MKFQSFEQYYQLQENYPGEPEGDKDQGAITGLDKEESNYFLSNGYKLSISPAGPQRGQQVWMKAGRRPIPSGTWPPSPEDYPYSTMMDDEKERQASQEV